MKDELQQHKKSDTVKWILTLIAFVLVGVMLIGIIFGWFTRQSESNFETENEQEDSLPDEGGEYEMANGNLTVAALSSTVSYDEEISAQANSTGMFTFYKSLLNSGYTYRDAYSFSKANYPFHLYVGSNRGNEYKNDSMLKEWAFFVSQSPDGAYYDTHIVFDKQPVMPEWQGLTITSMSFWYINPSTGAKVTVNSANNRYNAYMRLNGEYAYVYLMGVRVPSDQSIDFHFSYEFLTYPFPDDPVMEGHTFDGWYEGADEGSHEDCIKYDEGTSIFEDTQMHAHFTINTYTVTYDSGGGSSVPCQTVDWNTTADLPAVNRTGYTFTGWFLEDGTEYADQPIKEDTTLTAQWERIMCTVSFFVNGELYDTKKIEYGSAFTEVVAEANTLSLRVMSITSDNAQAVMDGIVTDDNVSVAAERMSDFDKAVNTVKRNKWAILGGVAGGVVFIAVIAAVCNRVKRKR